MKASSYRLLIIVASMTFVIGSIFVYTQFIRSVYGEIQVLRAKRDSAMQTLALTQQSIESIKRLSEKYDSLTELKDNFSLMLPSRADLPAIINQIEVLAKQNDVKVTTLTVEYVNPKARLGEKVSTLRPIYSLLIDMRLAGEYTDMKDFLESIQTNTRIMDVVSLKINGGGSSAKNSLEYSIIIQTYYQN
ncbi:MAG: type 4a pilus biogenesis protein PilO [bacterium]